MQICSQDSDFHCTQSKEKRELSRFCAMYKCCSPPSFTTQIRCTTKGSLFLVPNSRGTPPDSKLPVDEHMVQGLCQSSGSLFSRKAIPLFQDRCIRVRSCVQRLWWRNCHRQKRTTTTGRPRRCVNQAHALGGTEFLVSLLARSSCPLRFRE